MLQLNLFLENLLGISGDYTSALLGGGLIGLAVTWFLFANGRVTGISGIVNGFFNSWNPDSSWRLSFILGLIMGGFFMVYLKPDFFETVPLVYWRQVTAGILVGFGTVLGSGCTSGHGVCGLSRFSIRSLVATLCFMLSGFLTVFLIGV